MGGGLTEKLKSIDTSIASLTATLDNICRGIKIAQNIKMPKESGWYRIGSMIGQIAGTIYFSGYGYWEDGAGAGGSLMGQFNIQIIGGWGSKIENISYSVMNGIKIFPKLRLVLKGNDWGYLEVYWNGQGKWGTHLFISFVGMQSRSSKSSYRSKNSINS